MIPTKQNDAEAMAAVLRRIRHELQELQLSVSSPYEADPAVSPAQLWLRPTRAACGFGQASARLLAGR